MSTLTHWKYRTILDIKDQIIQTLLCQTQSFMVYISIGHSMEGKKKSAMKGTIFPPLCLSLCIWSLKGSCHINSKKKPDCQYWALWWLKRHNNQFWYFVPKQVIFLFQFWGRKEFRDCMSKHFITPNSYMHQLFVSKILYVLGVLPKTMRELLTALTVSSKCVAKWSAFKFPVRLCSKQK